MGKRYEGSKKYWMDRIKESIQTSDTAVIKAMLTISEYQVKEEQRGPIVKYNNGVGFCPRDVNVLTSLVNYYHKNKSLTPKQIQLGRYRISHYSRQLLEHSIKQGKIVIGETSLRKVD